NGHRPGGGQGRRGHGQPANGLYEGQLRGRSEPGGAGRRAVPVPAVGDRHRHRDRRPGLGRDGTGPVTRSRRAETAAGLGALAALLALVVGLPVLLYLLGGSPLPGHLSGLGGIGRDLLHRDSAGVVLGAVRDISWIAWAAFTLAVLNEIQATLRRRTPPRLFLGGLQDAAGRLVALAALTFTTAPVGTLLATP